MSEVVHNDDPHFDPDEPKMPQPPGISFMSPAKYYTLLQCFAILLTVSCPRTKLWRLRDYDPEVPAEDDILNMEILSLFFVSCVFAFGGYFFVNKSDPGYITLEGLGGISEDEEVGLVDVEVENCFDMDDIVDERKKRKEKLNKNDDDDSEEEEEEDSKLPAPVNTGANSWHGGPELNRQLYSSPRRKFCNKCGFAPPLRSHHCRICNKCVATFDHHCILVDACVGERNHCRFWWWLVAQSLCCWSSVGIISSGHAGVKLVKTYVGRASEASEAVRTHGIFNWSRFAISRCRVARRIVCTEACRYRSYI